MLKQTKVKQISKSNKTQINTMIQQICPLHEQLCCSIFQKPYLKMSL